MLKKLIISLVFLCTVSTISYSQEKFAVSGEVKFPEKKGVIILMLRTQEEFEKREAVPPERKLMIKPDAQQLKDKKVPFKFIDVPKGTYAISCIQDLNENGEMDYMEGSFGRRVPTEPYGFSGPAILGTDVIWSDVKFEVDKDISGMVIEVRSF
jgi:uncharacterized protein (DUF2141 family)